jgi:hypothetical protein
MARTYTTALGTASAQKMECGYIITDAKGNKIGEVFNNTLDCARAGLPKSTTLKFEYKPENAALGSAYAGTLKEAVEALAYKVKKHQEAAAAAEQLEAEYSRWKAAEKEDSEEEDDEEDYYDLTPEQEEELELKAEKLQEFAQAHKKAFAAVALEECNAEGDEEKPQTLLSDAFVVSVTGETIAAKAGYSICYDSVAGLYKLTAHSCTTLIERAGDLYRWCWVRPADAAPALRACEPQQELTVSITGNPKATVVEGYRATRSRLEIKTEIEEWGGIFIRTTVVRGNDCPDPFNSNTMFYTDTAVTVQTWRSINEVEISPAWYPILAAQGTPKITNSDATGNEVAAFWVAQIESFCQMWQQLGELLHALWGRTSSHLTPRFENHANHQN